MSCGGRWNRNFFALLILAKILIHLPPISGLFLHKLLTISGRFGGGGSVFPFLRDANHVNGDDILAGTTPSCSFSVYLSTRPINLDHFGSVFAVTHSSSTCRFEPEEQRRPITGTVFLRLSPERGASRSRFFCKSHHTSHNFRCRLHNRTDFAALI